MSFSIVLQRNASEVNKVDKALTTIATMTGTLKNETSIIDPVIMFEASLSDLKNCNYCTISEFRRSYFVNNIRSIRNGLVELTCHVDVLSTYKSQIRQQFALVKRQENYWNLYLNDGSFKVYQNPMVLTKLFPSGFTSPQFVLAVAGS